MNRTELVRLMSLERDKKPRPLKKMFGLRPSVSDVLKHKSLFNEWTRKYSKLRRELAKAVSLENPRDNSFSKAVELYENFTGHDGDKIARIPRFKIPSSLACMGTVDLIGYAAKRDGKTEKYLHEFKKHARPLLCVSPDGKQVFLIGGEFDFTERGFVDRR